MPTRPVQLLLLDILTKNWRRGSQTAALKGPNILGASSYLSKISFISTAGTLVLSLTYVKTQPSRLHALSRGTEVDTSREAKNIWPLLLHCPQHPSQVLSTRLGQWRDRGTSIYPTFHRILSRTLVKCGSNWINIMVEACMFSTVHG